MALINIKNKKKKKLLIFLHKTFIDKAHITKIKYKKIANNLIEEYSAINLNQIINKKENNPIVKITQLWKIFCSQIKK